MSEQVMERCDNCRKEVPQSKIATHFGYCRRNIKRCDTCGQMYDINFIEDHEEEFHKVRMQKCQYCKKQLKPADQKFHQSTCSLRTQFCEYCELDVPYKDYQTHLRACEARTKNCEKCRKPISNKDFLVHTIECQGIVQDIPPQRTRQDVEPSSYSQKISKPQPAYNNYDEYIHNQQKSNNRAEQKYSYEYKQTGSRKDIKPASTSIKKYEHVLSKGREATAYTNGSRKQVEPISGSNMNSHKPLGDSSKNIQPSTNKPYGGLNSKQVRQKASYKGAQSFGPNSKDNKIMVEPTSIGLPPQQQGSDGSRKYIKYGGNVSGSTGVMNEVATTKYGTSGTSGTTNGNGKVSNSLSNSVAIQRGSTTVSRGGQQHSYGSNNNGIAANKQLSNGGTIRSSNTSTNTGNLPYKHSSKPRQQEIRNYSNNNNDHHFRKKQTKAQGQNIVQQKETQRDRSQRDQYVPSAQDYDNFLSAQDYGNTAYNQVGTFQPDEEQELQKAIMMSMGISDTSQPSSSGHRNSKPSKRIDDIPVELLETNMMNESFYSKQRAIYEEIESKNKRK